MRTRCFFARVTALASCVVLGASLAACTSSSDTSPPSPRPTSTSLRTTSTPTPTPSVDPEVALAKVAILEAYRGFWAAQVRALVDPSVAPPAELSEFAVDKAFAGVGEALLTYQRQGIIVTGEPVLDPTVDNVTLGGNASAHITDCVDSSNWVPIFRDSRKPAAAPGQSPRLVVESWAIVYDARWVIRETLIHRDQPC
jgi:hypothetical protein